LLISHSALQTDLESRARVISLETPHILEVSQLIIFLLCIEISINITVNVQGLT
jgi:hypothetical protein